MTVASGRPLGRSGPLLAGRSLGLVGRPLTAPGLGVPYAAFAGLATLALAVDLPLHNPSSGEGASLMLLEVVVWVCIAGVVLNDALHRRLDSARMSLELLPELFVYGAWCSVAVILAYGVTGSTETIGKLKNLLPGLLLFALLARTVQTFREIAGIIGIYVAGTVVNAALGIVQLWLGAPYLVPENPNNVWKVDLSNEFLIQTANGLTSTPNNLAALLLPGFVLTVTLLGSRALWRRPRVAGLTAAAAIAIAGGLYASYSKGGMIWSLVGASVALLPLRRGRFAIAMLALVAGFVAILLAAFVGVGTGGDLGVNTVVVRMAMWQVALQVTLDNGYVWLFGGAVELLQHWNSTIVGWPLLTTHNTWLDQVVYFGLPALGLYLLTWCNALRRMAAGLVAAKGLEAALLNGAFGALVGLGGFLIFEPRADGVFQNGQVFFLMALGLCLTRLTHDRLGSDGTRRRRVPWRQR